MSEMNQTEVELRADVDRLKKWVDDLQSRMYVNCVYCGHRYGPADKVAATMADHLKRHIAVCPKHPVSKLLRACTGADHAISSLLADRGGITDGLLERVQALIREAMAEAQPKE